MNKDTKKDIPGHLLIFDIILPDRSGSKDKSDLKEGIVDDTWGIFDDYTCEHFKGDNDYLKVNVCGFYCKITGASCVYPDCWRIKFIKR